MYYLKQLALLFFLVHVFTLKVLAQHSENKTCPKITPINATSVLQPLNQYIDSSIAKVTVPRSKTKKALIERYNFLDTKFSEKEVVKIKPIENELNTIVNAIIKANPQLGHQKFNFFYGTDYVSNAASFGHNVFCIYAGLFDVLENDQQLAFVMCHEIAHQVLDHFYVSLEEQVLSKTSKLSEEKPYNRYKNKRELELDADALGYQFYSNLNYPKTEALNALVNLKHSDSILYAKKIDIETQFDFKAYPFKSFWVKPKEKLLKLKKYTSDFRDLDALRTHPNVDQRVQAIENGNFKKQNEITLGTTNNHLAVIKKWQASNYLCILKQNDRYDLHLFFALEKYNKNPNNSQAAELIASALYNIYKAKKHKQFSKFIPPPNPFVANTSYTKLKRFLKHTEAREIRKIGLAFCEKTQNLSNYLKQLHQKFIALNQ